ncbi:MAG TPA: Na/Pi symporter, partial [Candidatus Methylacidiphilales bacterium]
LGTAVGMTIIAQLLASGLVEQSGWFLIVGVVAFQWLKRDSYRGVGQCLLALGLLFLGLHEVGRGAEDLATEKAARDALEAALGNRVAAACIGAVVAVALQSSTASVGLAIGLATGGFFPAHAILPWIVGTNAGVSVTALVVGWKSLDGRRLGAATLLARAAVALPLFLFAGTIMGFASRLGWNPAHEIASLQTAFNLVVGLVALPFLDPLVRCVRWLVADGAAGEAGRPRTFLDEQALESPSLALAQATRQTQLMADRVESMLRRYRAAETERNTDLAKQVQREDDLVDAFNADISAYLGRIGEAMGPEDARWQFALLGFSNELESVGDVIDKNLCDSVIKRAAELVTFSDAEAKVLAEAYETVLKRLRVAAGFLSWRDAGSAKEFLDGKEKFNDWCRQAERDHFQRLKSGEIPAGSGPYFLDLLNSFRRINSHLSSIGYAFEE